MYQCQVDLSFNGYTSNSKPGKSCSCFKFHSPCKCTPYYPAPPRTCTEKPWSEALPVASDSWNASSAQSNTHTEPCRWSTGLERRSLHALRSHHWTCRWESGSHKCQNHDCHDLRAQMHCTLIVKIFTRQSVCLNTHWVNREKGMELAHGRGACSCRDSRTHCEQCTESPTCAARALCYKWQLKLIVSVEALQNTG